MLTLVRRQLGLGILLGCLGSVTAAAQDRPVPQVPLSPEATLAPVLVAAPPPLASSSEQLIPGLIINQHQGGGKAEQYLIRGFDADHGTDLALFVDGIPVHMRSHAHGQGYADLHLGGLAVHF